MLTQSRERRWLVLAVLCIVVFLVVVDNTIVNVALPTLSRQLHASNSSLQWIVDGYSLPFAGFLLAGGALSNRFGRKRMLLWALVLFGLFSLLAAFSRNVETLLAARALMGASAAFIFPATLSTLTVLFDDTSERAKAFGVWGATTGIAIALGPVGGGALLIHFWYGSIFLVNVPLVFVAVIAVASVVPESKSPQRRPLDVFGLLSGTAGVTALVLAIIEGPTWGWRTFQTVGLFVVAVVLLYVFTVIELRRSAPLLDVRIFHHRTFSAGTGAIATNFFCLFGFIFLVTQYFQSVRGYSALSAGLHTLPFAFGVMVTTPLGAWAAHRFGTRYIVSLGLIILAVALFWMSTLTANTSYLGPIVGVMITLAVGFSMVNAPSVAATMDTLAPHQIDGGAAGNETTRELGGTMGVAIIGSVFSSLFGPEVRRALSPFVTHGLGAAQLNAAQSSMHAAQSAVYVVPIALRAHVENEVVQAFMDGLHRGCLVAGSTASAVALIVYCYLPAAQPIVTEQLIIEV